MKEKRELPVWSIVLAIGATLAVVAGLFIKNGTGEASKSELVEIRQNQRRFSSTSPTSSPQAAPQNANGNFRDR